MKRLTTETPKDNLETALNLFYIKDHETWVRGGGPGPEYADVSLFDFIRDVAKTYIPDVKLPEDDDDLSNMMPEWLMDGIDSAEGIVALLYAAAWAYAELRHKLMRYEDNGLTPEEIKNALDVNDIIPEINVTVDHIRDLIKAENEGLLMMLPCGTDVNLVRDGHTYKADHWNHTLTAFRDAPENKSGKQVALFSIEEAEAALAGKNSTAPDAPEEPAEPEWKERVMRTFLGGR